MAGTILMTAITFHYQNYYMETLFVGNTYANLLTFLVPTISLLIGAFAYPVSGHLSDKLKTRFGKRRPFFFLAIPCGISFMLVSLPAFVQVMLNFTVNFLSGYIFILIFYIIFISCWRFVQCPFLALFVDVTKPEERVKASIFLNMCDLAGTLIGIGLPLILDFSMVKDSLSSFLGSYNSIEISGYIFGFIYIIAFMIAFILGPREDLKSINQENGSDKKGKGFLSALKEILKIPTLRNYIISAFFFVFCFNMAFYYLMPYLNSLGLTSSEIMMNAIPLFLFVLLLFFIFSRISKSWGKIKTFKISLLWGAVGTPFLLIIGVTNLGPLTIVHQLMILFIIISGSIVGLLIFQYAVLMDLGKLVPLKESTFVGVYSSIIVFSGPLATFIIGLLTQYLNPINFWIWNGNLGYASIGIVMGIGFLISYIFMKRVDYEDNTSTPKKVPNVDEQFKINVNKLTEENNPIEHIKKMDYPRQGGSSGEKKGSEYIISILDQAGLPYNTEEFPIPHSSKLKKLLLPVFAILWGLFSLYNLFFLTGIIELIFAVLVLLVPLILIIMIIFLNKVFKRLLKGYYNKIKKLAAEDQGNNKNKDIKFGKNIIAEYSPSEPKGHIVFTAHYDSISLLIGNMKLLTILGIISISSLIIYSFIYFAHYILVIIGFPINLFGQYSMVFIIILLLFMVPITILLTIRAFRSNKSHGAIDDLTGTSILLELVKIVKEVELPFKITFAFFSCEELGLLGSAYHYYNNIDFYNENEVDVISIDMIGEIGPLSIVKSINPILPIKTDENLNDLMVKTAEKLGIKFKNIKFLYPGSDFAHWLLDNKHASWIINNSKYIHTSKDVVSNVNIELLNECLKLITGFLLEKAKQKELKE